MIRLMEFDTLWLAGLLEGEAHFASNANGCQIKLDMTDRDIVERAAKLLDVKIFVRPPDPRGNRKQGYRLYVFGDKAVYVLNEIYPFMGQRRGERIKSLIERAKNRMTLRERGLKGCRIGMTPQERGRLSAQSRRETKRNHGTKEMFPC